MVNALLESALVFASVCLNQLAFALKLALFKVPKVGNELTLIALKVELATALKLVLRELAYILL